MGIRFVTRASRRLTRACLVALLSGLVLAWAPCPAAADTFAVQPLAMQLGSEDRKSMQDAIVALGLREEPEALLVLQALEFLWGTDLLLSRGHHANGMIVKRPIDVVCQV